MGFLGLFGPPNIAKLSAKGDLNGLVKALGSQDGGVRRKAAEALEQWGSDAEPALTAALEHRDAGVRQAAAEILERIRARQRATAIIRVLDQGGLSREDYQAKVQELAAIGAPVIDPLMEACAYMCPSYARDTVQAMGGTAVTPLLALLKGSDPERLRMASVLLALNGNPAVEALIPVLECGEEEARWEAAFVLGDCNTPRVVEALRAVISLPGSPKVLDPVALLLDLTARYPQGVSKTRGEWQLVSVGRMLNILGGLPLMLEVHEAYTRRLAQENVRAYQDGWSRNVDRWWDGIGEWRG